MTTYIDNIPKIQALVSELDEIKKQMTSFAPEQLEVLYAAAYSFYEQGKYAKSLALFIQLVLHNPFDARFWKGLASSHQMEGNYAAAVRAWGIVCILEPESSIPHFHAAECFISLGEKKDAFLALHSAQNRTQQSDPLFHKTELLQERLDYGVTESSF